MNPLIDQSKINFYSRYEIYTKEIWRMIYYLRCVDSAYYTPMSMKSGLIMMNHILQRQLLSSASPFWDCHLCPGRRARTCPVLPGEADPLATRQAGRRTLCRLTAVAGWSFKWRTPGHGRGGSVDDGLYWAWPEPRGPGSSAMIQLELLWRLIFSDDPFGAFLGIDRRLDFVFW